MDMNSIFKNAEKITRWQHHIFDILRTKHSPIILYGAGNIGRKVACALQDDCKDNIYFADQSPSLWGTRVEGIPVLAPLEAASAFGKRGLFVITVFNRETECEYTRIVEALSSIGVARCIPWVFVGWKYADLLLSHFFLGSASDILPHETKIQQVSRIFSDTKSKKIFRELLYASLTASFTALATREDGPQYFIPEVLHALSQPSMTFADCGAYDGDTLRDVLKNIGHERIRSYYAFEPDVENFNRLEAFVTTLPTDLQHRIFCHQAAVSKKSGYVSIANEGTTGACVTFASEGKIPCIRLDEIFPDTPCDFIKMDIEGHEIEALCGAEKTIRKNKPILTVCVYHKPDDFFVIPLKILALKHGENADTASFESKFFLRKHFANLFETVCYSV